MNIVGIVGASAMRDRNVVENLILALRFENWTVSTIKRAPDGFDLDQPGKTSYERREAGCREVMLVGDRRLALLSEFHDPPPSLSELVARLEPVDVVVAQGFQGANIPTVEFFVSARHGEPRCQRDDNIIAVVSDDQFECRVPRFDSADSDGLCRFLTRRLGLERKPVGAPAEALRQLAVK